MKGSKLIIIFHYFYSEMTESEELNKNENKNEKYIEDKLNEIGAFGNYQKLMMLMMLVLSGLPAMSIYFTVFNLAQPNLICKNILTNETIENNKVCDAWNHINKLKEENSKTTQEFECEFEKTYYGKTLKTDWKMYCGREYLSGLTQTIYLVGTVCAIFNGYFGDRFGRRKSIIFFLIIIGSSLLISQILISNFMNISVTAKYIIYTINQFIIGIFAYCLYVTSYLLLIESTTQAYRTLFSNIHLSIYVFGEFFVLIPSYLWKDWEINNWILLGVTVISILISIVFLNESPRWLISQNRPKDALVVLKKIAIVNRKQLNLNNESIELKDKDSENSIQESFTKEEKLDMKLMFKQICFPVKSNLIKLILLTGVWLSLNLLYYGVSLGVTSIDSINPYLMYIFSSIAEFLGYMLCIINDKIGRRRALIIYFLISGIICLVVSFIPRNEDLDDNSKVIADAAIIITLVSIGKCMASAAFNTCYLFTAEFYPTNVRNFAFSFISCIGNVGKIE